jgi:hypothetical protein
MLLLLIWNKGQTLTGLYTVTIVIFVSKYCVEVACNGITFISNLLKTILSSTFKFGTHWQETYTQICDLLSIL